MIDWKIEEDKGWLLEEKLYEELGVTEEAKLTAKKLQLEYPIL